MRKDTFFAIIILFFMFISFIAGMFAGRLIYDKDINQDLPNPAKNYDCKGTINSRCPVDTIEYNQHPMKKCWYLNYEDR